MQAITNGINLPRWDRVHDEKIEEKKYSAMGCGESYAMGAFSAIEDSKIDISTNKKIEFALNAAAEFSAGVRPPFLIYCLE